MKIIVDQEGAQVVRQLCDIALKSAGIQNLQGVISILNIMRVEPPLEKPVPKSSEKDGKEVTEKEKVE